MIYKNRKESKGRPRVISWVHIQTFVACALLCVSACTKSQEQNRPGTSERFLTTSCEPDDAPALASPQEVTNTYIEKANKGRWCELVNFYESPVRSEVALSAFKSLTALAGAQGPHRDAYRQQFDTLLQAHGVKLESESDFLGLFLRVINPLDKRDEGPVCERVKEVIARVGPEPFYVDVMKRILKVDPDVRATYDKTLKNLEMLSELATATIMRNDGQAVPIAFRQTPSGWVLTVAQP